MGDIGHNKDLAEPEELIKIHIDYYFLKHTDLNWIFNIIARAAKETRIKLEEGKYKNENQKLLGKRISIIIDTVSTEKSIDMTILFAIQMAMDIVRFPWLLYEVYNHIKKMSAEKRFIGKRRNLKRVTIKNVKRKYTDGEISEEVIDEFDMEISEE